MNNESPPSTRNFKELVVSFVEMLGNYLAAFLQWIEIEENQKLLMDIIDVTIHLILIVENLERRNKKLEDFVGDVHQMIINTEFSLLLSSRSMAYIIDEKRFLLVQELMPAFVDLAKGSFTSINDYFYNFISRSKLITRLHTIVINSSTISNHNKAAILEGIKCYENEMYWAASRTLIPEVESFVTNIIIKHNKARRIEGQLYELSENKEVKISKKGRPIKIIGMSRKTELASECMVETTLFSQLQKLFKYHNPIRHGEPDENPRKRVIAAICQLFVLSDYFTNIAEQGSPTTR